MTSLIQVAESLIEPARTPFLLALGEQDDQRAYAAFNREAGFAAQALARSEFALKIARANPQSVVAAVTNVAAIGISLNPAKKQAYLVPRKDGDTVRICLDIGYMGLIDLATQSQAIRWAQAEVVRECDVFRRMGIDKPPVHEFEEFSSERGDIIGVYCVVKTADGDFLTHTMPIAKVFSIRDRSQAWKSYRKGDIKTCPWATDEEEMVKKTCLKQGSKLWPRDQTNDRLERAIHYLNTEGGEGLADLAEPVDAGSDQPPASAGIKQPQRRQRSEVTDVEAKPQADRPTETAKEQPQAARGEPCTEGERAHIKMKAGDKLPALLQKLGIQSLEALTKPQFPQARKLAMELA